jgi:glycosyltransferase involved in cell wall biosynthesis
MSKVAILSHGYIPHFRVRLYELLAEQGTVDYTVFHGAPPSWIGVPELPGPFAFSQRRVNNNEFRLGPVTLVYQPVLREILTGGYNAVVVTAEAKFFANLLLALLGKLFGIRVLFWGFGFNPARGFRDSDEPHPLARAANLVKNAAIKFLADGFMAYTRAGRDRLVATGFPVDRAFVLQNTIDMTEQIRLHEVVAPENEADIRRRFGLRSESIVFVFIGRLVPFKRVELLIDAVRRINEKGLAQRPVEAIIIGSGPAEAALKAQAAEVSGIHFLGALPPNDEVARCLKVSAAVVIGGLVGLVVNHAFAHGRPVITRESDGQSPELEYIIDGENGMIVAGDPGAFTAALARFADSSAEQQRLAAGALRSREALRIETMAQNFDNAVRTTIARGRSRRDPRSLPASSAAE